MVWEKLRSKNRRNNKYQLWWWWCRLRQRKLNINTEYVLHYEIKTHSLPTEWVSTTRRKFFVVDFGGNMDRRYSEGNKENQELRLNIVTDTVHGTAICFRTPLTLSSGWLSWSSRFLGQSSSVVPKGFCFEYRQTYFTSVST